MPRLIAHFVDFILPRPISDRLPMRLKGWLEYQMGNHELFYPWGGPMNGQAHRLEIARRIIETCGISRIIETGTFRATTTTWFAEFGLPVDTVEANPRYHEFAKHRLAERENVTLHFGNSRDVIDRLTRSDEITTKHVFFYLDAHWEHYLPLADELSMILTRVPEAIVLIDDFEVPNDPGYGFDNYGGDNALRVEYLDSIAGASFEAYRPAAASQWETGARRGCVVVTSSERHSRTLASLGCVRFLVSFPRGRGPLTESARQTA